MRRRRLALACAASAAFGVAATGRATEIKALIRGVADRALMIDLQRAVGEARTAPSGRLEARRRAGEAAQDAQALLRSEGYYDASVAPDVTEGAKPRGRLTIDIGPRTLLAEPTIRWVGSAPDPEVQAKALGALKLRPDQPARAADILAAEGAAVATLAGQGYADAAAQPRRVVIDHARHRAATTYRLSAGGRIRLGGVELARLGRTNPTWVRDLAPWRPGAIYRPQDLAELERRLTDTRVYDAVTVALAPTDGPGGRRDVVVTTVDRQTRSFDLSAGYSSSEGGDFDVRWSRFNDLRRGDTITLEARLAQLDSRYGGELQLPHFLSAGQTFTPAVYYFRTITDAYNETGETASVDLTQRYGKTSYLTRGISVTNSRVDDKELGDLNLTAVRLLSTFFIDRSDNTLDPTRGWKADARVVPTFTTGDERLLYLRAVAQVSTYFAFQRSAATVVALRARLGSLVGAGIPAVPAQDRFFAGGGGSVRGYGYQGVGPHYPDTTPKGGLSLVEASIELRQRIGSTPFSAVVFVDGGSVGPSAYPQFQSFETAVGVGARYSLGFAPIRADLAVPLQHAVSGQPPIQIYLSVGQSF